jgi:four helix bundle suffix protein
MPEPLLPPHGGYRRLKSFQVAQLVYDVTVRFCDRYIDRRSRTRDQMVQAARSGVQNIAEGSMVSGTSKKSELKLTGVAKGSLEELLLDYEHFLRHRRLSLWPMDDPRRKELVALRCKTVDEVAAWISDVHARAEKSTFPEAAANAGHILTGVALRLVERQLNAQAKSFEHEGGFTERLFRVRSASRNQT